jgi:hypothetical protein
VNVMSFIRKRRQTIGKALLPISIGFFIGTVYAKNATIAQYRERAGTAYSEGYKQGVVNTVEDYQPNAQHCYTWVGRNLVEVKCEEEEAI